MQALAGTELGAKVISKLTRRLLPFMFLLYIVNYLDRINVGFAALQMRGQLGFSDKVYGLGAGIFFAGYFFFQVPSNLALARLGARKWIAVIMVLWGTRWRGQNGAQMLTQEAPRTGRRGALARDRPGAAHYANHGHTRRPAEETARARARACQARGG